MDVLVCLAGHVGLGYWLYRTGVYNRETEGLQSSIRGRIAAWYAITKLI